jgi:hypothetical protein
VAPTERIASRPGVDPDPAQIEPHPERVRHQPHVTARVVAPDDGNLHDAVTETARQSEDLGAEALVLEEVPRRFAPEDLEPALAVPDSRQEEQ